MAIVSLELFKKHVRSDEFADDDDYLAHVLAVAEETVIRQTNRTVEDLTKRSGGEFPLPLKHAIMLLAGHWYNQRESVSATQMHPVPETLDALVKPFRKLVPDAGRAHEV